MRAIQVTITRHELGNVKEEFKAIYIHKRLCEAGVPLNRVKVGEEVDVNFLPVNGTLRRENFNDRMEFYWKGTEENDNSI